MIIYKATNDINNKVYIGQTIKTLKRRKQIHEYEAKNGSNFHFHRAIKFHGLKNFIWEILEECNSMDELNRQEIMYIDQFETLSRGYNMTTGGGGILGFNHSQETKDKIAKANLGNTNCLGRFSPHTEETKDNIAIASGGKSFYAIKDEEIIGKWVNQTRCARELNLIQGHISSCLKGKRKIHKGFTFRYLEVEGA